MSNPSIKHFVQGYFDESGKLHDPSGNVVAFGGCAATGETWRKFTANWGERLLRDRNTYTSVKLRARDEVAKRQRVAITFADDKSAAAPQAADMVAYCYRAAALAATGEQQRPIIERLTEILKSDITESLVMAGRIESVPIDFQPIFPTPSITYRLRPRNPPAARAPILSGCCPRRALATTAFTGKEPEKKVEFTKRTRRCC
jgi:hypothetical protein